MVPPNVAETGRMRGGADGGARGRNGGWTLLTHGPLVSSTSTTRQWAALFSTSTLHKYYVENGSHVSCDTGAENRALNLDRV